MPAKHAGQHWTRIDAQHPEDNVGTVEGEATRLKAEVGVDDKPYFEGVVRYEEFDLVLFGVRGIGVVGVSWGTLEALTRSRHT